MKNGFMATREKRFRLSQTFIRSRGGTVGGIKENDDLRDFLVLPSNSNQNAQNQTTNNAGLRKRRKIVGPAPLMIRGGAQDR